MEIPLGKTLIVETQYYSHTEPKFNKFLNDGTLIFNINSIAVMIKKKESEFNDFFCYRMYCKVYLENQQLTLFND